MAKATHELALAVPLVLAYHALSESWPARFAITPEHFRAQLAELLERGYRPATFLEALDERGLGRAKTFAVTFDDAYRSVIEMAFPPMRELGVPGTVFVPTSFIGSDEPMAWPGIDRWRGTPHEREMVCMTWEQLEELAEAGWEIGSHTHTHPKLTTLGDQRLADELGASREILAGRLDAGRSLAYPFGDEDERVQLAAREAGYVGAAGVRPGAASRWRWPRVGIYASDGPRRFSVKTNPLVRRARGSSLGTLLERVRNRRRATEAVRPERRVRAR